MRITGFLKPLKSHIPRRGRTPWRLWLRNILVLATWCAMFGVIGVSLFILDARRTVPDPQSIVSRQVKESTKLYDRTGTTVLYDIYDEERRTVVGFDRINKSIREATIAIEDSRFYEHSGFDLRGFLRSIVRNVQQGYGSGGGSTITQQLVGNALVGREKTLKRKVQELILAVEVERRFTKDEILEMYLNQIPYGSNAYGVEAAAQTYFGVPAAELTIAQAALVAALPQRPSYLLNHPEELQARKETVLSRMHELGFINQSVYDTALAEELVLKERTGELGAPHFMMMAREYVINKYGKDIVESGGFRIITTLDADLQSAAEQLVAKYADINKEKYKATNAALVAIDPKTGEIKALVGSADYFDTAAEGNYNVATARRQPGSSFKPFAYAAAFQKGYTDTTILWDFRTEFNPGCSPDSSGKNATNGSACYHPQNYSGTYSGPVTMRQALARSLNTAAVQTLYLAGIDDTMDLATRLGITTLEDRSRFGLSLVLGGAEVRLVDMVSAYGVFAADGMRVPWGLIQRIEVSDGTILEERRIQPERVLDTRISRLLTDVLADNNARAPAFGVNNPLTLSGREVAAKTGTTQDNKDAWVIGYTPSLAVGVWVGNNHNEEMTTAGGGISAAGPLWNAFMSAAMKGSPPEPFPKPDPEVTTKIMLNGNYVSFENPVPHSILYYIDRADPLGPPPGNPANDPQYANWEWVVRARSGF